ncbi:MAG: GNAT family N-acetyltransferase [Paludibacter sp.]|jgi:GNAT superfamily N-acetyltransferase|nr:GNAT family N-acetyltransferase [Paludibacter sp.]
MLTFLRTNSTHQDFISLVRQLDIELATIDGDEHSFYVQYNKIDKINHVIIAYENELPIACGAIKQFSENTMEVKRMYILAPYRGKGTASGVLIQLEKWAAEMNYSHCILETGIRQPDAIRLYGKNGYLPIPNYGQYAGVENSRCFEKAL